MKIALIGSAPASVQLAPYDDPEWTIWGCSPGAVSYLRRVDAYFEIHRWRADDYDESMLGWLRKQTVYVAEPTPLLPDAKVFPAEDVMAPYKGLERSFFTSSLAWMLAFAIQQNPEEIGLWGVDMADTTEYGHQKPGCHFFLIEAEKKGIRITVPPESDLLRPIPLYGIGETSPIRIKLDARKLELQGRLADIMRREQETDTAYQNLVRQRFFLQGALDDLNYTINTWT